MSESSCRRELRPPIKPSAEDDIVSAAKAHAATIRRTLWLKEYKRADCRAFRATSGTAKECSSKPAVGHSEPPPTIDGPIYTPSYWRKWQRRSKGRKQGNVSTRSDGGNITRLVVSRPQGLGKSEGTCCTTMSGNVGNVLIFTIRVIIRKFLTLIHA